jgi:UDP-N-acetylglucosamine/UDP-N-acetylgalactosamine 4-epimerase
MSSQPGFELPSLEGPRLTWLVTGAAGFIGSNLSAHLLRAGQSVVALDNFVTGHRHNIADLEAIAANQPRASLSFIEGDITSLDDCARACEGVDRVLHQAALGSVPRSMKDPLASHAANVDGFINMLNAARLAGVKRFVYASSSSVYGDSPELPKVEDKTGQVLSPYAATKAIDEVYAGVFQRSYGIQCAGLRYFNVFGARQDPNGPYAAVIPKWLAALIQGKDLVINGDGTTSRDFCYIDNVIQANLRAALIPEFPAQAQVFNVAFGQRTTLLELAGAMRKALAMEMNVAESAFRSQIQHVDFRAGDIKHSLANIDRARSLLGYEPKFSLAQGMAETVKWYLAHRDRLG